MTDSHFSPETIERFYRSELTREETRDFVRHLLKRCPSCCRIVQEVSQRENFQLLVRGLEDAALHETEAGGRVLGNPARFVDPEARPG